MIQRIPIIALRCTRSLRLVPRHSLRPLAHSLSSSSTSIVPPKPPRRAIPIPTVPTPYETIELLPLPRSLPPRRALLLISIPIPPIHWPSHLEIESSLIATTSAHLKSRGIGVHVVYDGTGGSEGFSKHVEEEKYTARLFWPDGTVKTYKAFDIEMLNSEEMTNDLKYEPRSFEMTQLGLYEDEESRTGVDADNGQKEIFVCTHGSRDCRCSDRGGPLVLKLREEVERRGLGGMVKIGEIAHVGGHKYAANALLLPSLDMLSNLTVEHAPALITHVLDDRRTSPMWAHWRGRIGLTEEQQADLWASVDPASAPHGSGTSNHQGVDSSTSALAPTPTPTVSLRFKTFEGEEKVIDARVGENLLDVGKAHALPSIEGVCGGHLECATCHLYLSSPTSSAPAPVPHPSDEELDMLGYALGYKEDESRLGCQIKVTPELARWCADGGVIGLPRF